MADERRRTPIDEVHVVEVRVPGTREYIVIVNGRPYDHMDLWRRPALTWAQMQDIADGYREALTHYENPMV